MTADEHRYEALRNLAWARDLEANPPADQAQVEGLARVLAVADDQGEYAWTHYVDTARRLVKAGVTVKAADR